MNSIPSKRPGTGGSRHRWGALGYFLFFWLAGHGFYGMIIPGGLLGIGAGIFKSRSITIAVICGFAALALGLFTEWRFAPFVADDSLGYFLGHFYQLNPTTLVMIAVGAAIGFWHHFGTALPFGRRIDVRIASFNAVVALLRVLPPEHREFSARLIVFVNYAHWRSLRIAAFFATCRKGAI